MARGFGDALPLALDVAPAPIIDEVLPAQACTTGATFTITGEHFVDGTEVRGTYSEVAAAIDAALAETP